MNKFFLNFLFCFTIIHASELDQLSQLPVERLPISGIAKQLIFWVPPAIALQAAGYYFDNIKSYRYNQGITATWSQYWLNLPKFGFNTALSFAQCGIGEIGNQFVLNGITVLSSGKPDGIKINKENLLMAYLLKSKKTTNPYQRINELFSTTANSCNMKSLFKNGWPPLSAIPVMLPASAKISITNFFLKKRISLLRKIDISFLKGLLLSFELAEYIVKGWSGQHHVNDTMIVSLHWLLLASCIGVHWYWGKKSEIMQVKNENILSSVSIKSKKGRIRKPLSLFIPKQIVIEGAKTTSTLEWQEDIVEQLLNYDTMDDTIINGLRNKFERNKKHYKKEERKYREYREYQKELKARQRKLFFWNIIALIGGIFFHAFLNASFYWYKQYQKV